MSTLQTVMALTAAAAVGTAYVLIHEHRRKLKTHRKKSDGAQGGGGAQRSGQGRSDLISRDLLLAILAESATAAFQLIEQVRSAPVPLYKPQHAGSVGKRVAETGTGVATQSYRCAPSSRAVSRGAAWQTRKMVHLKHKQTGISLEQAVDELQKDFEVAMEAVVSAIRQKHGVSEPQMTQVLMEYQADVEVQTGVQTLRDVRPRPHTYPVAVEAHTLIRTHGGIPGLGCKVSPACLTPPVCRARRP
jgi:hypothetical protein